MRTLPLALLCANAMAAVPESAKAPQAPTVTAPATLPFAVAMTLIRATLAALQQADDTGNYAVMAGLRAQAFRAANPPERLAAQFASLRSYNLSAVMVSEPKFTQLPQVDARGGVGMAGFYALDPYVLSFRLGYVPEGGRWRLDAIAVSLGQVQPAGPGTPQP